MGEKLDWKLQFDLVGTGLQDARGEMDALQRTLAKGTKAMLELEIGGKKVNVEIEGMAEKAKRAAPLLDRLRDSVKDFARNNWAAIGAVTALGGAIAMGLSKLDEFGDRAIRAFGERQGALRAYTTLFGSEYQARAEFGKAGAFAAKTDLTFEDTLKAQKKLAVAGFRNEKGDNALDRALLTVADVASMAAPEERALAMERLGKAFADVKSKGKLQGEELKQLSEAGLSRKLVVEEVAKAIKVKDNAAAEKKISKGEVSEDVGIAAIQRAALRQFGTSKLGEYAVGAAGSLSGLLSNRDEAFANQLRAIDSEALPSVERYKDALADQGKILDLATKSGRNLSLTLQDFANQSIGLKSAWTDFTTGFVDSFTESYMEAVKGFGLGTEGMNNLGDTAKALGRTLGENIAPAVANLNHVFEELGPPLTLAGGLLNLFWETIKTVAFGLSDIITILIPYSEKIFGRTHGQAADDLAKRVGGLMDMSVNGGYEPGQAPWEIRERRIREQEEKDAKERTKDVIGARVAEAVKKSSGAGAAGKGGGGLGSIGGDFVPDYRDLMGGMSLPRVTVPGFSGGMSFASVPYVAEQQRALSAGIAARGDAAVTVENVEIVIDGATSPQDVAQEVANVLRGLGRYAHAPRTGVV